MNLNVGHKRVVFWRRVPCRAILLSIPARKAQSIRARLFKFVVGVEDVTTVVLASERDPAVIADVVAVVVYVSTVVWGSMRVEIEPVACALALICRVVRVKVHAHPDGHIARAHVGIVHDDGIVEVVQLDVDSRCLIECHLDNRWRRRGRRRRGRRRKRRWRGRWRAGRRRGRLRRCCWKLETRAAPRSVGADTRLRVPAVTRCAGRGQ